MVLLLKTTKNQLHSVQADHVIWDVYNILGDVHYLKQLYTVSVLSIMSYFMVHSLPIKQHVQ